jgi:methionyl-tRNA synthetase
MTSKKSNKCYITTAIDYVNSLPHIGTAYEKIGADVLARWHRMLGHDVHFQMGNDEHSLNVQRAAKDLGMEPKAYCDEMRTKFEAVWQKLDISFDGFIQTSDPHHVKGVQQFLQTIMDRGDIERRKYEGWYCESCEAFLTEKDLVDGHCPNHKSKPTWLAEENYFFKLTNYRDRLLQHIEAHPEFILPDIRRNEIVSFLRDGLQDISVSRASAEWGIPVPGDPDHVVYVWFDALINYITSVGYGSDEERFAKWWPADVHVIGKDITRFHCIIWPAMLMSAGIPLPKTVFGHGFVYLKGEKMSKTLGNVVTPMDVIDKYGADPLRYYLLREGGFGRDADFTWEHFIERYNGDLANGIGNLVSRTVGMATRYQDGIIKQPSTARDKLELADKTFDLINQVRRMLDYRTGEVEFHNALAAIWGVFSAADRHINESKPWEMYKTGRLEGINNVLWDIASALQVSTALLFPFMPSTTRQIWKMMGYEEHSNISQIAIDDIHKLWGELKSITVSKDAKALFMRIEEKKEDDSPKAVPAKTKPLKKEKAMEANDTGAKAAGPELIDISDFAKIQLRTARITSAEKVDGADKLLKLQVSLGTEERQIVAGIAQHYDPAELVGKDIVVVANLKPAKLRGIESQGMLLAASDESTVSILTPLKDVKVGSKVK